MTIKVAFLFKTQINVNTLEMLSSVINGDVIAFLHFIHVLQLSFHTMVCNKNLRVDKFSNTLFFE